MTQLIHWIKHADQFDYIIFVCCLQYLLTSSLVRHNIFEFVKQLNDDQRILENMNHSITDLTNRINAQCRACFYSKSDPTGGTEGHFI